MHLTFEQYHEFSAPLEGRVSKMYCDVFGLITTGVGNLINTQAEALALPWLLADGSPASKADVLADFNLCRANAAKFAKLKWSVYAGQLRCHLSDAAIDELVKTVLARNESYMRRAFPEWDKFPADAQLACLSMAWAVGAGWPAKFVNCTNAIRRQDWEGAVASCKIREGTPGQPDWNPGVVPRNAKNRFLFHNAAIVKAEGLPVETLHWPNVAPDRSGLRAASAAAAKAAAELKQAALQALSNFPYQSREGGAALRDYEAAA